jgi:hypothetical protein
MATRLLMPKATAVWLVDNTSLTFEQIADFCGLHPLQVKGIADGEVEQGIKGLDPVASDQLTRQEIEKAEKDPDYRMRMAKPAFEVPEVPTRKRPRYTPVSKRQERPDAIYWLLRNHPELSDSQVQKLVGTTKTTIQSIRDRTHWNSANIKPVDPVSLGLCSQIELDDAVRKAAERKAREEARSGVAPQGAGLKPVEESLQPPAAEHQRIVQAPEVKEQEAELDADSVFAKLKPFQKPAEEESSED